MEVALGSLVCWLVTLHIAGGLKQDDLYGPYQPRTFYDIPFRKLWAKAQGDMQNTYKESDASKLHST